MTFELQLPYSMATSLRYKYLLLISILTGLLGGVLTAQSNPAYVELQSELSDGWTIRLEQALLAAQFRLDTLQPIRLIAHAYPFREQRTDQMKGMFLLQYEIVLELVMSGSEELLASESFTIDGAGTSKQEALRNCRRALVYRSPPVKVALDNLFTTYQERLYQNCDTFLAQISALKDRGQLTTALALADGIPVEAGCYQQARTERLAIFQAYQEQHCATHIRQAKLHLANQLPKATLNELAKVDPGASCAVEVEVLLSQATQMMKNQQSAKAQFLRQVYQNQMGLEQARTEIINNIIDQ